MALPDFLKGLAILLMIQVHLMELLAKEDLLQSSWGHLSLFLGGSPAAPLFMVVMGYFAAFKKDQSKQLFSRGLKLILWGILLNIGLNLHLIYRILFDAWTMDIYAYIFGVDILPLAGLSLIFIAILPKVIKKNSLFILSIIFAVFIIKSLLPIGLSANWTDYIMAFFVGGTYWSYFPLIPWLIYPLLGLIINLEKEKISMLFRKKPNYNGFILAFILFLVMTYQYASNISHDLPVYYQHDFSFFVWTVIFLAFLAIAISPLANKYQNSIWGRYLVFLSKNITAIYVFQWLIIGNLATAWYKQIDAISLIIYFVVITSISSLLSYMYAQIKIRIAK